MLTFLTILMMLIVAYAYFREGLFTAFAMLVNVVLAGVITFNFWEPLAGSLDSTLQNTFLDGYQDFVVIIALFAITLGLLRTVSFNLAFSVIEFSPTLQQFGGAAVGLVTGYLLSGFLLCALETLPWHRNFLDFESKYAGPDMKSHTESDFRRMIPADRIWLATMRHAGAYGFARDDDNPAAESPYDKYPTFDRAGTFELRYYRYRRYPDTENPLPYLGELDRELNGPVIVPPPLAPPSRPAAAVPPAQNPPPVPTPGGKSDTVGKGDTGKGDTGKGEIPDKGKTPPGNK